MNPFDYALGLLTMVIGLALAGVAFSLHKLVVRARTVQWDGRPLAAAALVIVETVRLWSTFILFYAARYWHATLAVPA